MRILQVNQKSAVPTYPLRESHTDTNLVASCRSHLQTLTVSKAIAATSCRKYTTIPRHIPSMLLTLTLILLLSFTSVTARRAHKRLIIHVPFRIKTHHHTHTVYAHIRSASSGSSTGASTGKGGSNGGGTKQTIYKILSFAMQGKGFAGHTGHGGGGGGVGVVHKSRRGGGESGGRYEHEHVGGHGGAHEHGPGDIMYDDYHGGGDDAGRCSEGGPHGYGDMVFNHFSRSSDESNESDEYPEVEEYVDEDEQRFVWE